MSDSNQQKIEALEAEIEKLKEVLDLMPGVNAQIEERQAQIAKLQQDIEQSNRINFKATDGGSINTGDVHVEGNINAGGDVHKTDVKGDQNNYQIDKGDVVQGDKHETHIHTNADRAPDPQAEARTRYLKRLFAHCNALPLDVMGESAGEEGKMNLDAVYISLDTQAMVELTDAEKEDERYKRKTYRPVTALEAADQTPRLVLLGSPGSGKSSFVRRLAAREAKRGLDGETNALFPLLMTLRDLATTLPEVDLGQEPLPESAKTALVTAITDQWLADIAKLIECPDFGRSQLSQELDTGRLLLIFDGLDEVPEASRHIVWRAVESFLQRPQSESQNNVAQIIVTCRTRSYSTATSQLPQFKAYTLALFDRDKIKMFVQGWYLAVVQHGRLTADVAQQRAANLQQAVTANGDMLELAASPLLLTTMTIIHQQNKTLPRQRVLLYAQAVEILLLRWQTAREIAIDPALEAELLKKNKIIRLLEQVAYELHQAQYSHKNARLEYGSLLYLLEQDRYFGDTTLAKKFLDYIDLRAGLLIGQGGERDNALAPPQYEFPHRTFQEYLAGCYLARGLPKQVLSQLCAKAAQEDYWRVPVKLGLEERYFNQDSQEILSAVAHGLLSPKRRTERTVLWSGYISNLVEPQRIQQELIEQDYETDYPQRLQQELGGIIENEASLLTLTERAEVGRLINLVGDPRDGVGLTEDGLPDILWGEEVPAGTYQIGGDERAFRSFDAQSVVIEESYRLARYPVTYAQFQSFLLDGGAENDDWWEGIADRYREIESPSWPLDNHPRETVSWYQAVAFCRWLSDKLGYEVGLPHEYEWEVAARYSDGRVYPFGNEIDKTKANYDESIGQTTAVGLYPNGIQSNLNLHEMSGNVFEWCQNKYGDPAEIEVDESDDTRVWRGGSWLGDVRDSHVATCHNSFPYNRDNHVGFRLRVVVNPISRALISGPLSRPVGR